MATTADQIVVEILASIEQHTKATKKVADDTKRDMAAVEGAVTKAEDATAKAADSGAAAAEKGSKRKKKAAQDSAAADQAAADASAAAAAQAAAAADQAAAKAEGAAGRKKQAAATAAAAEQAAAVQSEAAAAQAASAADGAASAADTSASRRQAAVQKAAAAEDAAARDSAASAARSAAAVESAGQQAEASSARKAKATLDAARVEGEAASAVTGAAKVTETAVERSATTSERASARRGKAARDAASAEQTAATSSAAAHKKSADAAEVAADRTISATQRAAAAGREALSGSLLGGVGGLNGLPGGALGGGLLGDNLFGGGSGGKGRGRSGGGLALQNASFQLQDFIVQVTNGTGALRAFGQQAPQLLSGFGQWGAVIGIAAAGVGVLATALGGFETAAEKAAAAQKDFDAAMKASKGTFSAQEQEAIDLVSALSLVEQGLLNVAGQQIEAALRSNATSLAGFADQAKTAAANIKSIIDQDIADRGGTFLVNPDTVRELNAALADLTSTASPTAAQINRVLGVVQQMAPALRESGLATDKQADSLGAAAEGASRFERSQVTLEQALGKVHERQGVVATSSATVGGAFTGVGNDAVATRLKILDLVTALAAFNSEATRTRSAGVQAGVDFDQQLAEVRAQTEAYKKGKDAVDAHADAQKADALASAAADAARKQGLGSNDQRAAADEARAAVLAETTAKRGFDAREKAARAAESAAKRGAGAAAKHDEAVDKSNLKIQQQIDLNQRLIAVYADGEAARERAKAQYDAESEARARNIKVGTAEYDQFVKQRTDDAERLRLSNLTLADYAKGEALTKSSMTAQEAYNASLIELNKLRAEGAITTETYDRAVLKLNADHNGYVEGINAIAQAIQGGIQGATSFGDALVKVGLQLAQLLIQAAAFGGTGGGPLGKAFDSLFGTVGGLIGGIGGASSGGGGVAGLPTMGAQPPVHLAGGGQALPGNIYQVGETGREWFAPSVPGQVIPNSVIKNAAGGGGGSSQPINIIIPLAGANGDRAIAEITAAGVKKGLQSVPELNRQHAIRFA